jgi:hypothetical protein
MSIITKPSTPDYREGWERIFGSKEPGFYRDKEGNLCYGPFDVQQPPSEVNK